MRFTEPPVTIPAAAGFAARAKAIFARYPEIAAAYVFGSVARGTAGPESDLDIGILFRTPGATALDHHRLLGDLASRLEAVCDGRPLDLVVLETQGWLFRHRVLLEGKLVYEADRDRRISFEAETYVRAFDFRPTYEIATRGRLGAIRRRLERS
ncbi:MAG: nucleotidyltransferase domain-containing protein [Planctomycetota bacterium]